MSGFNWLVGWLRSRKTEEGKKRHMSVRTHTHTHTRRCNSSVTDSLYAALHQGGGYPPRLFGRSSHRLVACLDLSPPTPTPLPCPPLSPFRPLPPLSSPLARAAIFCYVFAPKCNATLRSTLPTGTQTPEPQSPRVRNRPGNPFFFPVPCICICIVHTTTSSILRAVRALGFQPPKVASLSFAAAHFSIAHVFTLTIVVYDSMR